MKLNQASRTFFSLMMREEGFIYLRYVKRGWNLTLFIPIALLVVFKVSIFAEMSSYDFNGSNPICVFELKFHDARLSSLKL